MRKAFVFSVSILTFFLTAEASFAAKVCLQVLGDSFWELKGGKIDKKSFTLRCWFGASTTSGFAEISSTDTGSFILGALTGHDVVDGHVPVILWSAEVDENFNGAGTMDVFADGVIDDTFTVTQINCSSLPSSPMRKPNSVETKDSIVRVKQVGDLKGE